MMIIAIVIMARRMNKKQQMRWKRWTVQPFLDVRVAVLDGSLEGSFRRIYPDFRPANDTGQWPPQRELPTLLYGLDLVCRAVRRSSRRKRDGRISSDRDGQQIKNLFSVMRHMDGSGN